MRMRLNHQQREKLSDFFLDVAKILFGGSVLGPLLNRGEKPIDILLMLLGCLASMATIYGGLTFLKRKEDN